MIMRTSFKRQTHPLLPAYKENAALQLIIATGSAFVIFFFAKVIMITFHIAQERIFEMMYPNLGLSSLGVFQNKVWTILTYGWLHSGFFDWATNMIWLYCFASILQSVAGYKQVIPLFFYAVLVGGAFYLGSQLIQGDTFNAEGDYFLGSHAGVLALGIAALTLVPTYKLQLGPTFGIPLVLVVGIYIFLDMIVFLPGQAPVAALCLGGVVTGLGFGILLRNGYRPGEWIYDLFEKIGRYVTPSEGINEKRTKRRMEVLRTMYEPKTGISQSRIDDILDKINDHGYNSLTREERDILLRASKD